MNKSLIWKKFLMGGLLSILSACSHSTPAPDPADIWHIEYRVSGGIMGKVQGLNLSADGQFTVFDKRRGIRREFIASKQQLHVISEEILRLNTDSENSPTGERGRHRCADCITSQLIIRHKAGLLRYRQRIGVAGNPAYGVVLQTLSKMLNQGLAGTAGKSMNR